MIIRVFRAVVHPGKQREFGQFFINTALPHIKAQSGLVSITVGTPLDTSAHEFLMVMVWQDLNALKGFAGEHWEKPVIHPEGAHLLKETFVSHYNAAHYWGATD